MFLIHSYVCEVADDVYHRLMCTFKVNLTFMSFPTCMPFFCISNPEGDISRMADFLSFIKMKLDGNQELSRHKVLKQKCT